MTDEALDKEFQEAVDQINNHSEPFPADFLLRLYAFYKVATDNYGQPSSKKPIINAFKTNALFQVKGLDRNEAKRNYIDLVNKYFLYRDSEPLN